ncbi:S-adenosyl-L-methionine-dependent methyltransferase [Microstroma glucosiphilum]|uniref:S-adenosyl-L-methionine-dependent methyltransferase n=1 Tax=Pseudomicrostroma glucosiphilum TaxID=1684307 RepID=A0A316UEZ0_9BASI|nr:S-adenosyl-L-methionine-dependent methyltransferase [Pseudomicrostroma glucosiphilum]PWN23770.1 S-adenosyl-L-methionine-dependent methyltransferase [Pseudomicrostroma glucosiphilum]
MSKASSAADIFGADDFDVDRYLSNRPRFPPHIFSFIKSYLSTSQANAAPFPGTLLDLGCGPGFSSFPLLDHPSFDKLIGIDTGKGMVRIAPQAYEAWLSSLPSGSQQRQNLQGKPVSFSVASSSDLSEVVQDNSVNLAIAATAAHWFDPGPTWAELSRALKPGGAVVWFTYGENYLPRHPTLQGDIYHFMQGDSKAGDSIGPYFPQPGRSYLTNLLQQVPFPHEVRPALPSTLREQWDVSSATRKLHPLAGEGYADLSWTTAPDAHALPAEAEPFRLEQVMSWERYESYIRSASAYHAYMREHAEEKEGPEDVVGRFVRSLRGKVDEERKRSIGTEEALDEAHVRVAWPLGLMAIKKKAKAT